MVFDAIGWQVKAGADLEAIRPYLTQFRVDLMARIDRLHLKGTQDCMTLSFGRDERLSLLVEVEAHGVG